MWSILDNNNKPLLEMKGITKDFGGLRALSNVDLVLYPGEVLGLVGENAAGKSTLIKILTGVYPKTAGEIFWQGKHVDIRNRHDAMVLGIDAIYQTLALVESLNVYQNLFLGKELRRRFLFLSVLNNRRMEKESNKFMKDVMGLNIPNFRDPIINLSGGQRQAVAIARSVYWDTKLVVMDEPTASLGVEEINKTFEIVRNLKKNNTAIIFITHNMEHIFEVADKIMVLRRGEVVGYFNKAADTDKHECIKLMVSNEKKIVM